ncbi:HNH endonuclease [Paenibacillus sp. IHBB 3054]|uniref:HNH endonuclease n=1 Tax=Paenibacillus sp. IHBB 3054 TaxID=3425689 RepID=UPI003F6661C4
MEKRLSDYISNNIEEYFARKRTRNQKKVKELKEMYKQCCQICGVPIVFYGTETRGVAYSEVCHIWPHGEGGPDIHSNMVVLCPNHHIMFDLGIITILPDKQYKIFHIDVKSPLHNKKVVLLKHQFSLECLNYHYNHKFLPTGRLILESY